ncbi:MAG: hypothetical protein A2X64_09530 [Ignavibacteria bacterium GWF2_33_9]|nr:MAG: hypothetical protein A2X64_09530 [Ignavibacteria bacterium GWF2_33_9]
MDKFTLNREDELINRLLDRDLTYSEESAIMDEISTFPEYKDNLTDYLEIQKAIKNDRYIVPTNPELDKAVFLEVDNISRLIFGKTFISKYKYSLLGLLLLFFTATTYFTYYAFNSNELSEISQNTSKVMNSSVNNSLQTDSKNVTPVEEKTEIPVVSNSIVNSTTASNSKKDFTISSEKKNADIVLNNTDNTSEESQQSKQDIKQLSSSEINNQNSLEENLLDPRFNLAVNESLYEYMSPTTIIPKNGIFSKISRAILTNSSKEDFLLQYRGLYAVTNPEKSLQGRNFYFNSYCFGGFIEAFNGIYLGGEFGSEPYSQIYLDPNTSVQYEQSSSIFYFGLASKFEFKQFEIIGFHPAAQLFAGSSSLGPIVRSNLTMQYDLLNMGFFFGLEGGSVLYSNQGIWYNTSKLGFIGGLNIKL